MVNEEEMNVFWGFYILNRQWGIVREDISIDGNRFLFFILVVVIILKLC